MIPKTIKIEHILKSIQEIDSNGIPPKREARKFGLSLDGKIYPPKYVISLAYKHVGGIELDSNTFEGGLETNDFLKKLGFEIIEKQPFSNKSESIKPSSTKVKSKTPKKSKSYRTNEKHTENCPECKNIIHKLLQKIYEQAERDYKIELSTHLEDFKDSKTYKQLKRIYTALRNYRGFENFTRAKKISGCDFYVPNPGFILEFDESQHFTTPRKIALQNYPLDLEVGFSKESWIKKCEVLNRKDNDPVFRDEQRAWYDTLRDFLPALKGLNPSIRIFAKRKQWCSLDPDNPKDVEEFKSILNEKIANFKIDIVVEPDPYFARITIGNEWSGNPEEVKKLLENIYKLWPKDKKTKFLVTCGGFIQFDWPESLKHNKIQELKKNKSENLKILVGEAKKCIDKVITDDLKIKFKELTDCITLGVDSFKAVISKTSNFMREPHIELVFLIDLKNNIYYWTGKSYPTSNQEKNIIDVEDFNSHFFDLSDVGNLMILGCHDLTLFNNRNWVKTGEVRKLKKNQFRELAERKEPCCVIHHPHTTVKKQNWSNSWTRMKKTLPSLKRMISTGKYHKIGSDRSKWTNINTLLQYYKKGNCLDFICYYSN